MPSIDFSTHDPEFTQEQEEQCHRIVDGIAKINARIMRLSGSVDALTSTADQVDALLASLDEVTTTRALESYRFEFDLKQPNNVMPFNPATGEFNPIAPKVKMEVTGNKLVAHCEFSNAYESAPDTVQGGMVAAFYDQVLAFAVMIKGVTGPTLWLKVDYLKPTPINEPLRFECEVSDVDGKKFSVNGCCYCGDKKITEAEALVLGAYELAVIGRDE